MSRCCRRWPGGETLAPLSAVAEQTERTKAQTTSSKQLSLRSSFDSLVPWRKVFEARVLAVRRVRSSARRRPRRARAGPRGARATASRGRARSRRVRVHARPRVAAQRRDSPPPAVARGVRRDDARAARGRAVHRPRRLGGRGLRPVLVPLLRAVRDAPRQSSSHDRALTLLGWRSQMRCALPIAERLRRCDTHLQMHCALAIVAERSRRYEQPFSRHAPPPRRKPAGGEASWGPRLPA